MNNSQIIKFIERQEILEIFEEESYQHLLGFFRKSEDYVLYCSIIKEDDGTFEYYYNCNHDVAHSHVPDNSFTTFEECKRAMLTEITGLSCKAPSMWGFGVNRTTAENELMWKVLGIKEEYPGLTMFSSNRAQSH